MIQVNGWDHSRALDDITETRYNRLYGRACFIYIEKSRIYHGTVVELGHDDPKASIAETSSWKGKVMIFTDVFCIFVEDDKGKTRMESVQVLLNLCKITPVTHK